MAREVLASMQNDQILSKLQDSITDRSKNLSSILSSHNMKMSQRWEPRDLKARSYLRLPGLDPNGQPAGVYFENHDQQYSSLNPIDSFVYADLIRKNNPLNN